jgi:uncharacterized protein
MKTYHFLPVFLTIIVGYIAAHFYVAIWLAKRFSLGNFSILSIRLSLLIAAFMPPLMMFLKRQYYNPAWDFIYTTGLIWIGIILIANFIFFCTDIAIWILQKIGQVAISARLPSLALIAFCLIFSWALYGGLKTPPIKELTVSLKQLPPALVGLKIAQISDMHLDAEWKLRQLAEIIAKINAENPDLVLVTGDFIDHSTLCKGDFSNLMKTIKSRLGVYGVLGNHEYYYGMDRAIACYHELGITLLKNAFLDFPNFRLIGLGDIHTEHLSEGEVISLLEHYKSDKFNILMTHQPIFYDKIATVGDYFGLSGHTHSGQIFPFGLFTRMVYPNFYGIYREQNSAFYVTSGAGTWGPPLRWLAPAEIPTITLNRSVN